MTVYVVRLPLALHSPNLGCRAVILTAGINWLAAKIAAQQLWTPSPGQLHPPAGRKRQRVDLDVLALIPADLDERTERAGEAGRG